MRVTLDWDDDEAMNENLDQARSTFDGQPWEFRQSSGGSGYHFVAYDATNSTPNGFGNMMNLRKVLGDDPKRMKLDQMRWARSSPFMQVLYRRKYMDRRDFPAEDGSGYSTGNTAEVIEQSQEFKAAPEEERIKDPETGELNYQKALDLALKAKGWTAADLSDYLGSRSSPNVYADEPGGRSSSTVRSYLRGEREVQSDAIRRWTRRQVRSRGIGHMAETKSGGKAAENVEYLDEENLRRVLVEYVDVPFDWNIGDEEREYALLNIHTGSFNHNHTDRQLNAIHDEVANHAMEILSPENPETGTRLNLDPQNTHFSVDGWSREPDSINWEHELLDPGEGDLYLNNLPASEADPATQPVIEVILWNQDMTDLEWHYIGIWAGSTVSDMETLKDSRGWW